MLRADVVFFMGGASPVADVGGVEQLIWEGHFMQDELLKQRAQGLKQLDFDGFTLSLLSLLQLIDDKFIVQQ